MSHYDYEQSKKASSELGFYALLMAAMREADTRNATKLRLAFPDVWAELMARYAAPGGLLEGETFDWSEMKSVDFSGDV